jgi:hypothetical protein
MAEVGRLERPVFTWNPVEQRWIQERGGETKAPPTPHDVHAIQTWFLDPDENEWIQTVLGPMGRQLAAQWRGAYRVPEHAVQQPAKPQRAAPRRSPLPFAIAGAVLLALIGGVAMAAPSLRGSAGASAAPSAPASAQPSVEATPAPTPEATAEPTAPPTPAPTQRPVRPAGPSVTLSNGTVVTYTGPTSATRGGSLPASFTVIQANGRPGSGPFAIILDRGDVANRRSVVGSLDGAGRIAMQVPTNIVGGTYQLQFSFAGYTGAIASIIVR